MNRRSVAFWVGLALLLLVVGLAAPRQGRGGAPLDPDATNAGGTAALVELLERFGSPVDRRLPGPGATRALLLSDGLTGDQQDRLERWVEQGGTLVVTDPTSVFAPPEYRPGPAADPAGITDQACDRPGLPSLRGLRVEADQFIVFPPSGADAGGQDGDAEPDGTGPPRFEVDGGCFAVAGSWWLVVQPRGAGRVVAVGGGAVFTNRNLGRADNAVVAIDLLTDSTSSGSGAVSVLYGPVPEPGTRTLRDLIPRGASWAAWELVAAFGLYVLWRARRLGRPVAEPQPVELPGSLLVRATGELQRRSGAEAEASGVLRADLDRRLRRRLKAAPETAPPDLAALAATAAPGLDPALVIRALVGPPAANPADLVALVADIDRINAALGPEAPALPASPALPPAPASPGPVTSPGKSEERTPVAAAASAADRGAPS